MNDEFLDQNWMIEITDLLSRSALYNRLLELEKIDTGAKKAVTLVIEVCYYAYSRSKLVAKYMGEYTLHDVDHLRRVLILMEKLMPADTIIKLSVPELMLLICAAFFHDIGMAPSQEELESYEVYWDLLPENQQKASAEFKKFCMGHPEAANKINKLDIQGRFSESQLIKRHLVSEFIRKTHAQRAADVIDKEWNQKFVYKDSDLTAEFAQICYSHSEDALRLREMDSSILCGDGVYVCLPFVGVLLRLADLIDFDAKRTPEVLFQHLAIRNSISLQEWKKHRSIDAWDLSPGVLRFSAKCEHPAIEFAIRQFCDVIDQELSLCNVVISRLSDSIRTPFPSQYKIPLATQVDRSKIGPKRTPATNKPIYSYHETRFNLNKKQVIELLMGTRLYGNPETALRELVQNSIDACLFRQAMENDWGTTSYRPSVEIRFVRNLGEDILEVNDNGSGMDLEIIDKFYSNVGTSFYKSIEFNELKSQLNLSRIPISRFGIGVLSCFMVSDDLLVNTKRVKGNYESGEALEVTVEGVESIYYIKEGTKASPGTDTRLVLRSNHPWQSADPKNIIANIKRMLPAPPFEIKMSIFGQEYNHTGQEFKTTPLRSFPDFNWPIDTAVHEFSITINDTEFGLSGRVIVGVLEKDGSPSEISEVFSKSILVEGKDRVFGKTMHLNDNSIYVSTLGLIPDNSGNLINGQNTYQFSSSKGIIALNGIEIPKNPFPDYYGIQTQKAKLIWPIPVLFVIDVAGKNDLDLNSARTDILFTEKWLLFEERFAFNILDGLYRQVSLEYFLKLLTTLGPRCKSPAFASAINHFAESKETFQVDLNGPQMNSAKSVDHKDDFF